jgi:hypothetical protein
MKAKQHTARVLHVKAGPFGHPCLSRPILAGLLLIFVVFAAPTTNALAQTTRTNRSAAPTTPSLPSSSATSPMSPCDASNPTSPCFSAKAPGNPCYSALGDPCSGTTTPTSNVSVSPPPSARPAAQYTQAITADQARAALEAGGYSKVEQLRKDAAGTWRGKAQINGDRVNVTLYADGTIAKD